MADRGAHFYRCDFQVHTPRDNRWKGKRPVTDADRKVYADSFVNACRSKCLQAVAITDHHDFVMFPFIREAARIEVDDYGNPVDETDRLVVFPGLELTLAVPCQALLILDADLPVDRLEDVLTALNINPVDPSEPCIPPTIQLDIDSFQKLHDELDRRNGLKGRYIILPNVTDGGHRTLMRSGMSSKYREMPCVGGYLDGTIGKIGDGNKTIFAGKNRDYGFKRLAVFQTADSRSGDFTKLGDPATWVKWARPTAEAIRQACLAEESRISHDPPALPSIVISRLTVSNSKFLGPIELELNRQYNAVIGGRGTGKSTILGYLKWALCDQSANLPDSDELGDPSVRQRRLVQATLAPFSASVDVHFEVNRLPHVVRRNAGSDEVQLKIGNGGFQKAQESEIRELLPIQAYNQKQLSSVSVRIDELTRFVTSPIRKTLREIDRQIEDLSGRFRTTYSTVQRYRQLDQAVRQIALQEKSLKEQAENLRRSIGGITDDDRKVLDEKPNYDAARSATEGWASALERAALTGQQFGEAVRDQIETLPKAPVVEGLLGEKLTARELETRMALETLRSTITAAINAFKTSIGEGTDQVDEGSLEGLLTTYDARYEEVKTKSTAHTSRLNELADVERQQLKASRDLQARRQERNELGDPISVLATLQDKMLSLVSRRADTIEHQCAELSQLSQGLLRATLRRGQGLHAVQDAFRGVVSGSGIRLTKIETLIENLGVDKNPLTTWWTALNELEQLAAADEDRKITTETAPVLARLGLTVADLEKVARKLTPDGWLSLALTRIDDHPVFEYRTREDDYIDFDDASAGQQATALLKILLALQGPPLIIDQPEDDLDSEVVQDIVKQIWSAKSKRQLIFASHNANLVVNGDAELVVCCSYRTANDQSGGKIKLEGAIDVPEVRQEITTVMEGGEKAFRLRKEKYGF